MVKCPLDWASQAHNISAEVNGRPIAINRHLVVATRVNPNARTPKARCLQVRAWNSSRQETVDNFGSGAAADVASACLFALFRNLGLIENARAITEAVQLRRRRAAVNWIEDNEYESFETNMALAERAQMTVPVEGKIDGPRVRRLAMEHGEIQVQLSSALLKVADVLIGSKTSEEADEGLFRASEGLGPWIKVADRLHTDDSEARDAAIRVVFPQRYREN
jgi:hypothetical protein